SRCLGQPRDGPLRRADVGRAALSVIHADGRDARSLPTASDRRARERTRLAAPLARAAQPSDRLRARLGLSDPEPHAARVRADGACLREHRSLRRGGAPQGRDRSARRSRLDVRVGLPAPGDDLSGPRRLGHRVAQGARRGSDAQADVGEREPLPAPDVDAVAGYLAVFFWKSSLEISLTSEACSVTSEPDLASRNMTALPLRVISFV